MKELLWMIRAGGQSASLANFQGGLSGGDLIEPRPEESDLVVPCDPSRDLPDRAFGLQGLADDLRRPRDVATQIDPIPPLLTAEVREGNQRGCLAHTVRP